MKKIYIYLLVALLLLISGLTFAEEAPAVEEEYPPISVVVGDKSYDVHLIWIDLNDPLIKVDLALAKNKIGTVEPLIDLSQSNDPEEEVIAAINASFFNMKPDSQPASTLIIDGAIEHIAEGGSIVGFDGDNKMHSDIVGIKIDGSVNNQWEFPYNWSAWNINHLFYQPEAVMLFDDHYTGEFPDGQLYAVAIDQHAVIGKYDYIPEIPKNGYILVQRTPNFLDLFNVGDRVDFRFRTVEKDANGQPTDIPLAFDNIENAAGAGPMLVKNGKKILDAKKEGLKITKFNSGGAKRSMIGVNQQNQLALLVSEVPITLDELTDIALQLGLTEAFNLDGGGSSGLVYQGNYLVEPERKISNAFVIKKLKEQPIRLVLNDSERYFDSYPFIYTADDAEPRTMVPLRGILEKIDATVTWDSANNKVIVERFGSKIVFGVGQKEVVVDGKTYQMDVPLLIHKDRSYVSVRFLTEFFGGTVEWNGAKKIVSLTLPTVEKTYAKAERYFANKDYAKALDQYQNVLQMFPQHVSALKRSAYIHNEVLNDQRGSLQYYQRILEVFSKDITTYNQLAYAYRKLGVIDKAIETYQKSNAIADNREAHLQLVHIFKDSDRAAAIVHANWLRDNAVDVKQYKEALLLLEMLAH